jgi:hypothetical protein
VRADFFGVVVLMQLFGCLHLALMVDVSFYASYASHWERCRSPAACSNSTWPTGLSAPCPRLPAVKSAVPRIPKIKFLQSTSRECVVAGAPHSRERVYRYARVGNYCLAAKEKPAAFVPLVDRPSHPAAENDPLSARGLSRPATPTPASPPCVAGTILYLGCSIGRGLTGVFSAENSEM